MKKGKCVSKSSIYVIFLLYFIQSALNGQEHLVDESYYLNGSIVNPAIAGSEYYKVINLSSRKQWIGIKNSPETYIFHANFKLGRYEFYTPKQFLNKSKYKNLERVGIGITLFNDNNGPLSVTGAKLTYAYHIPIKYSHLAFGLSANITEYIADERALNPYYHDDPNLTWAKEKLIIPNADFGIYFYTAAYFVGLSVNDIIPSEFQKEDLMNIKQDAFANFGYTFFNFRKFRIEPSVDLKYFDYHYFEYDLHSKFYYKNYQWAAFTYKSYKALLMQIGFRVAKIFFYYGYEINLGDLANYAIGSHEFGLGMNIGLRNIEGIRSIAKPKFN